MAVTVTFDGQLMHDMGDTDTNTGIANLSSGGGGAAPGADGDFVFQGANSISKKVTTTRAGIEADTSAFGSPRAADVTAADRHLVFFKIQATNKNALLAFGAPSVNLEIGSGSAAFSDIDIAGNENEFYRLAAGWLVGAINLNQAAFQSDDTGSPTLTAVNYFGVGFDFAASSIATNTMFDSINVGRGLAMTGNTPDGTIQDFIDFDEGTAANRIGCFLVEDAVVKVLGMHFIGQTDAAVSTLTDFTDSDRNIVFPDYLGHEDAGFTFDTATASTDIALSDFIITGVGRRERVRWNTEDDVDATPDEITLQSVIDAFRPGDSVIARSQAGTETPGLTDGTRYWIGKDMVVTPTGVTLHTTRHDACLHSGGGGGGTPVALTASTAGNGELWRLDKDNDTRPQLIGTGTAAATMAINRGTFTEIGKVTMTSVWDIDGAIFNNSEQWTQNGGRIDSCTFNGHKTLEAETFITVDDIVDIVSNAFDNTGGRGHALEFSQTGNIAFVGNTFTGYFSVTNQLLHQFDSTADVIAGATDTVTLPTGHGYVDGDAVVYSKTVTANTDAIGLTEATTYYVAVTGDAMTLHLNEGDALNVNAQINLTVGASNETHALWPANAAVFNNSGGALTLSVSGGGGTPSVRNALDSTTAADVTVTLTVQVDDENGVGVSGARVRIEAASDGSLISEGSTNGSGTYTDATYVYGIDTDVLTKVRLKGFKNFRTGGTILSTGIAVGVFFATDKIVDLP